MKFDPLFEADQIKSSVWNPCNSSDWVGHQGVPSSHGHSRRREAVSWETSITRRVITQSNMLFTYVVQCSPFCQNSYI